MRRFHQGLWAIGKMGHSYIVWYEEAQEHGHDYVVVIQALLFHAFLPGFFRNFFVNITRHDREVNTISRRPPNRPVAACALSFHLTYF